MNSYELIREILALNMAIILAAKAWTSLNKCTVLLELSLLPTLYVLSLPVYL